MSGHRARVPSLNRALDRGLWQLFYLLAFLEVSCGKELTDFLICSICLLNIIHNKQSLNTTIGQNENDSAAFKKVQLAFPCDVFVGVSDRIQCLFFF